MNEVVTNLFVGGIEPDMARFDGLVVCVLEGSSTVGCPGVCAECCPVRLVPNETWIPILQDGRAIIKQLNAVAFVIDEALQGGRKVLVHCGAGIERAPLAVAWYLHVKRDITLDQAYELIRLVRPVVQDRQSWLEDQHGYETV